MIITNTDNVFNVKQFVTEIKSDISVSVKTGCFIFLKHFAKTIRKREKKEDKLR